MALHLFTTKIFGVARRCGLEIKAEGGVVVLALVLPLGTFELATSPTNAEEVGHDLVVHAASARVNRS